MMDLIPLLSSIPEQPAKAVRLLQRYMTIFQRGDILMSKQQNPPLVYEQILERIMNGTFAVGERIPESRLAVMLHVSRSPVHTALLQLAQDGLVTLCPNSSAHVACYSTQDLQDIGTLRLSLDDMAIRLAMLHGSRSDFLALQKLAETCAQGMRTGNNRLRRNADCDFHLLLAKISQNHLLFNFQTELYKRVNFILLTHQNAVVNCTAHIQEHFELVDAIMQHDTALAHHIITHHLASFYYLENLYPPEFLL